MSNLHQVSNFTKTAYCTSNTCPFWKPHTSGYSLRHGKCKCIIACWNLQSGHWHACQWPLSQNHNMTCSLHYPPLLEHLCVKTAKFMHQLAIQFIIFHTSESEFTKLFILCMNMNSFGLMLHQSIKQEPYNANPCSNFIYSQVATDTCVSGQHIMYTFWAYR